MKSTLLKVATLLAVFLPLSACVRVDDELGKELIDKSLLYDTYTVEFDLEDIQLKRADDLSGYSDTRITIGAIRDEVFGLTTRSSAFTLVPALDTLDFGEDPEAVKFDIHFAADTVSVAAADQQHILQNIFVYELTDTLSLTDTGTNKEIPHGTQRITRGLPVYDGTDSLSFEFSTAFAQKYIDGIKRLAGSDHVLTSYSDYLRELPGIYVETDHPQGIGGRINMFVLSCLSVSSNYYVRNNNVALLTLNAGYPVERDGRTVIERKDTTFLFIPGEPAFYDESEYLNNNQRFYQYAFNRTSHEKESTTAEEGIFVEGGGGLKPVILARELQAKTWEAIRDNGGDPSHAVINKATIILPYEQPDDYQAVDLFPSVLSPTIRIEGENSVTFGGLTDASASNENQGDLDRSNLVYSPDITYHLQELLLRDDLDTSEDRDIWLLTVHTETVESASGSLMDNDYYRQMMYAMYYNSLYGGGYGYGGYGYGGYGYGSSYGYGGYSNYYNYLMLAQMMSSSSQSSVSSTQELDKDRYYCAVLNGTKAASRRPRFRVTFSLPQG